MATGDLGTTNMWLAIMAIVSVLEALVLIGMALGGFLAYRFLVFETRTDAKPDAAAELRGL